MIYIHIRKYILILYAYQILEEGAHLPYNYNGRVNQVIKNKKYFFCVCVYICEYIKYAWMAEWSKAADLSSVIFGCVGSNPTSGIYFHTRI